MFKDRTQKSNETNEKIDKKKMIILKNIYSWLFEKKKKKFRIIEPAV